MSGMPGPPPPPPPPPGQRGGQPPPFVTLGGGRAPPPPPGAMRPPGPPAAGGQPFALPARQQVNSTRVVDITPRRPLDEDSCRKRLTSYEAHSIRKIAPRDSRDKPTWAKAEITKEPLAQEDISRAVKRLNESKRTVQEKKAALMPNQQGQVNRLLDELMTLDNDTNFEWSLAQLDSKTFTNKKGQKETSTITVYVKRAPLKELNPIGLFNAIERNKMQRLEQMNRPPPRPEPHGDRPGEPEIIPPINKLGKFDPGKFGKLGKKLNRPKKYHDHSSASSDISSEEDSGSEYSSEGTTISTSSGRHSRRYSHKGRSQSRRPREHRKKYYIDDRPYSPEPLRGHRESMPYGPRYVPEVPRASIPIPTAVPAFDPVTAAYQAGKIDADAERFDRRRSEPMAIVSYGRLERKGPVYSEPLYESRYEPRYDPRYEYVDEREEEFLRRDDRIRREERIRREAEDYMDRRGSDSRLEPKIIYGNPFTPRRYPPSHSTRDSGW